MALHKIFILFLLNNSDNEKPVSKNKIRCETKRVNQKFISKNKKKTVLNVNGSFNIVRKVLLHFNDKEKLIDIEYERISGTL